MVDTTLGAAMATGAERWSVTDACAGAAHVSVRTVTVIIRLSEEHSVPFIVRCVRDKELALMPTAIHKARPTASVTHFGFDLEQISAGRDGRCRRRDCALRVAASRRLHRGQGTPAPAPAPATTTTTTARTLAHTRALFAKRHRAPCLTAGLGLFASGITLSPLLHCRPRRTRRSMQC